MIDPAKQRPRALDIAVGYVHRGWAVVPVPFREKGPRLKGWQNLRIDSAEQVALYFRGPTNIGVILGAASRADAVRSRDFHSMTGCAFIEWHHDSQKHGEGQ
jgi:hypothetical protein